MSAPRDLLPLPQHLSAAPTSQPPQSQWNPLLVPHTPRSASNSEAYDKFHRPNTPPRAAPACGNELNVAPIRRIEHQPQAGHARQRRHDRLRNRIAAELPQLMPTDGQACGLVGQRPQSAQVGRRGWRRHSSSHQLAAVPRLSAVRFRFAFSTTFQGRHCQRFRMSDGRLRFLARRVQRYSRRLLRGGSNAG